MTASAPIIQKIITFSLGGSSFAEDVIDIELVPVTPAAKVVKTLDGIAHQDVESEAWEFRITCIEDWDSGRPGLAHYLFANKGTSVAFIYNAHGTGAESASQPKMTGTCRLVPISYGGKGNDYATVQVVLPVNGVPVRDATP